MSANATPRPIDAAIDRMIELDTFYQLEGWPEQYLAARRHDIRVMAAHDLRALTTELLGADGRVLLDYTIPVDAAGVPQLDRNPYLLIDRALVKGGRFLVHRRDNGPASYAEELLLPWRTAAALVREKGDASGAHFIGESLRRGLVVVRAGPRFAFSQFADGRDGATVFLLPQFVADLSVLPFREGQRLSAFIAVDDKGLQGRAIRRE